MTTNKFRFSGVLLLLGLLSFHCEGASTATSLGNGASYLGSINGKTFYILDETATRAQAVFKCKSRGWRLASIETGEEVTFLENFEFYYGVWTSGYECAELRTFRWHNTISKQLTYIDQSVSSATIWNCAAANAMFCIVAWTDKGQLHLGQKSCTEYEKPLCQSV